MKKKILVTGGTGYIGSHTAVELINEGFEVTIIDNLYNSEAGVVDRIEQISGVRPELSVFDLCDMEKLILFFKKNKNIAAIIHFAAYKAVGESVRKPLDYYRNNLLSLVNLLDAMKLFGIPNLVFSSSCTVYGQPEKLPVSEQKEILHQKFADAGWEAGRILKALDNDTDIYFDSISQVIAPRWSNGRCAMTGDAAFCPSPLTGMGVSLSVLGAYILAGELSRQSDYKQAFTEYEKIFRPYVTKIQKLPPGVPKLAHPKSKIGISIFNTVINIISSKAVKKIGKLFANKNKSSTDDTIELPDYWKQENA